MKLMDRERVDGTTVTIGRRVYYKNAKKTVSTKYSAEFRDLNGKQCFEGLKTKIFCPVPELFKQGGNHLLPVLHLERLIGPYRRESGIPLVFDAGKYEGFRFATPIENIENRKLSLTFRVYPVRFNVHT